MGRTTNPLSILILDPALITMPQIQTELSDKGHTIHTADDPHTDYDVIIGGRCWRIIPNADTLNTQLKLMIAGVRNVKYPKGIKP